MQDKRLPFSSGRQDPQASVRYLRVADLCKIDGIELVLFLNELIENLDLPQSAGFSDGTAGQFYPGDSYVDWIEASDVMGGKTWPTFAKLFKPMYQWAAPRGKPLLVWVGVPENPSDPNWRANWFDGMRATLESSMPAVKGVLYYQVQDFAGNFQVDTTPQSWAAFRSMALDPYFMAMP
jgi:hypothetical protein